MANGTPISPYGYATIDPKDDIVAGSCGTIVDSNTSHLLLPTGQVGTDCSLTSTIRQYMPVCD